ncbi:MAG: PEP-CTERM sorting domain-containing protein [Verrucomicrobiota bacterium]
MKSTLKTLTFLSALALGASAQASVTEADGLGSSWLGTPTFTTMASPTTATTAEGNYGSGGSGSHGGLAQTFVNTTAGTLSSVQLSMGGSAGAAFNIFLYDLGSATGYAPTTSASFDPSTKTDLFSSGLSFTYGGGAGGAQSVVQLTFAGADAVSLLSNELYAFAIEPSTATAAQWYRGGSTTFTGGQLYRLGQFTAGYYGAINGGIRDAAFAATVVVPEPSSIALLGLGAAAFAGRIRRKN